MTYILLIQFVWTLDVEKFRTKMVNIAKTHMLLVKKETSDILSSNIVQLDWKVIYVFKLKRKNILFREINIMKNSLKRVNLDSSTTIAKGKLVKIFTVIIQNLQSTEKIKMERKNIENICWVNIDELTWQIWSVKGKI